MNDAARVYRIEVEMDDPKPVSINKLYSGGANRRFLTSEGKRFKDALAAKITEATFSCAKDAHDIVYKEGGFARLDFTLYVEKLYNGAWEYGGALTKPRRRKDGSWPKPRPRSPYQQMDATNYLKIVEDAIVEGVGIDDSANLDVTARKREDPERPRIVVIYEVWI